MKLDSDKVRRMCIRKGVGLNYIQKQCLATRQVFSGWVWYRKPINPKHVAVFCYLLDCDPEDILAN